MRFALPALALAAIAVPAIATEPQDKESDKKAEAQPEEAPAKEEKICRRIRTDISSRRKEKVCMTREEWVDFNNGN